VVIRSAARPWPAEAGSPGKHAARPRAGRMRRVKKTWPNSRPGQARPRRTRTKNGACPHGRSNLRAATLGKAPPRAASSRGTASLAAFAARLSPAANSGREVALAGTQS
jgi:hypothetical protein